MKLFTLLQQLADDVHAIRVIAEASQQPVPLRVLEIPTARCELCRGTGLIEHGYCNCALGKDLERVERRASPVSASEASAGATED